MLKAPLAALALATALTSSALAISRPQVEWKARQMADIGHQWQLVDLDCIYSPQDPQNVETATLTFECAYNDGTYQTRRVRIFFEPLNEVDMDYVRDGHADFYSGTFSR